MNIDKLLAVYADDWQAMELDSDGSFTMEDTNGTTVKYRWIKMPPIKEGYEIVLAEEAEYFLGKEDSFTQGLMTQTLVHMGGLILVKEKETEPVDEK
jgi:hypothetical protein